MITRLVKMQFSPESEALFLDIFDQAKDEIRARKGCMSMELFRSQDRNSVTLWTISTWQSESDLESYRTSALFEKTWTAVKPLFSEKARAWTLNPIETTA